MSDALKGIYGPQARQYVFPDYWPDFGHYRVEPQDAVSRLARLAPPEPPLPWPADSVEDALRTHALCPDGLIIIDSLASFELAPKPAPAPVPVLVLSLRDRIDYYFRGNLDNYLVSADVS